MSLTRQALDLLRLPPPLTVAQWAERNRWLSPESNPRLQRWTNLPFQVTPQEDGTDQTVRGVVLMFASQTCGKTEVINNVVGYHIDHEPSPILLVQPTVEMAEAWSKDRLAPMLRDTKCLRGKVADVKSRDSGNTILHKSFPGGHITAVGANAPSGLASRPVRVVLCDEVDRYPPSAGTEGDPVMLAQKRAEAFPDAVFYITSTPTIKGLSRIEAEFNRTDKRYWFVACPHCKHEQTLKWSGVIWPKGEPEGAQYTCESCRKPWEEADRLKAIEAGHWVATAPFKGMRGYHLNGLYCLFKPHKGFRNRLHEAASSWIEANAKGEETLRAFINTFLAETWEQAGEQPDYAPIIGRCEAYGPDLPAGALVLVGGADVQHDRIEAEIEAYGLGEESWGIQTMQFIGSPDDEDVWLQLERFWDQEFKHPCGSKLRVAAACVDSGTKPKSVYKFTRPRQSKKWYAVKGSSVPGMPLVSRPRKSSIRNATLFMIGTDTAKDIIYTRLAIEEPGPRYMHFPIGYGYTEAWFQGLTAEKLTTVYDKGFARRIWVKVRDRNEPLDCRVYSKAALEILNPNWAVLAKSLAVVEELPVTEDEQKPQEATKQPGAVRRRSNWVNAWRRG